MASSEPLSLSRRLMISPAGLCLAADTQRVPALSCASVFPCRLPYPGGLSGLRLLHVRSWQPLSFCVGLGIRSDPLQSVHVVGLSRQQSSLYAAARKLACPSPTRAFTFELSSHESPQWNVEYDYAARQSIAAAGLAPARHSAVQAATQKSRLSPSHVKRRLPALQRTLSIRACESIATKTATYSFTYGDHRVTVRG
jgi:hypothetical protein